MTKRRYTSEIWILGATGRIGHALAARRLAAACLPLVLVGLPLLPRASRLCC